MCGEPMRRDPLDRCRTWFADIQVLVSQDTQPAAHGIEEFTRSEQEVRIARAAEPLVAGSEGLVEQQPARRHAVNEICEPRPMKIVDHNDRVEQPPCEGVIGPALEVNLQHLEARIIAKVRQSRHVTVDGKDPATALKEQAGMPAGAAGQIQDMAAGAHAACESQDPRRCCGQPVMGFGGRI
jgi:hypothetical protein